MKSIRQVLTNIDSGNEFLTKSSGFDGFKPTDFFDSQNLNPTLWEQRARDFQERNLQISDKVETFTIEDGKEKIITVEEEPKALKETQEDEEAHIREYQTRQITLDGTEFTGQYRTSWKSMRRSFIPQLERFSRQLGYSASRTVDENAVSTIYSAADAGDVEVIYGGGKESRDELAEGDSLTLNEFRLVRQKTQRARYSPSMAFISPEAEMDLLSEGNITNANQFGGTEPIRNGAIARLYGFDVFTTHSVYLAERATDTDPTVSKNIFLGQTNSGEQALAYAKFGELMIEDNYYPETRKYVLVGHMDFGHEVIHPNAIKVVETLNSQPYTGTDDVAGSTFE